MCCREPNGYAYMRPAGQSDADALRVRCRVTVLMQRACDAVHRACAAHMPLAVQLQLLSVLQVWDPLGLFTQLGHANWYFSWVLRHSFHPFTFSAVIINITHFRSQGLYRVQGVIVSAIDNCVLLWLGSTVLSKLI